MEGCEGPVGRDGAIEPPPSSGWVFLNLKPISAELRQSSLKVAADLCIAQNKTDVDSVINVATLLADWATTGKVRSVDAVTESGNPSEFPV